MRETKTSKGDFIYHFSSVFVLLHTIEKAQKGKNKNTKPTQTRAKERKTIKWFVNQKLREAKKFANKLNMFVCVFPKTLIDINAQTFHTIEDPVIAFRKKIYRSHENDIVLMEILKYL